MQEGLENLLDLYVKIDCLLLIEAMMYQKNNSTEIKDYLDIAKQGISTFYNIGQMTRYRIDYLMRNQNRDKMIKHACLAGLGIIGLLAVGITSLASRE